MKPPSSPPSLQGGAPDSFGDNEGSIFSTQELSLASPPKNNLSLLKPVSFDLPPLGSTTEFYLEAQNLGLTTRDSTVLKSTFSKSTENDDLTGFTPQDAWVGSRNVNPGLTAQTALQYDSKISLPISGDIFVVPGSSRKSVKLRFQWTLRNANLKNEIGIFVLDRKGRVNGFAPGESGFAHAALTSLTRKILFKHGQQVGAWRELKFREGDRLAFYLIQNGNTKQWLDQNPSNNVSEDSPVAFFSVDGVNPDGVDRVRSQLFKTGIQKFSWEDTLEGGDRHFNDAGFLVSQVGLPVPGNLGQVSPLTVNLLSQKAQFSNEMGFFLVDDAEGRIGNLKPGDIGYAKVALAKGRRQVVFARGQASGQPRRYSLPSEKYLGWYLIQDGTTRQLLKQNPQNQLSKGPVALFSYPGANPDGLSHVHYRNGNEMVWEDQTGGGDRDYDDLIFRFKMGTPREKPSPEVPQVSINDIRVQEGDEGLGEASFTVSLSKASTQSITVDFETFEGSAKAGTDFQLLKGKLVFAPGEQTKTLVVPIIWDHQKEQEENFVFQLSNVSNATIVDKEGLATIEDNDQAGGNPSPKVPQVSINDIRVQEGDEGLGEASFTVSLSATSIQPVTLDFETFEGTAKAGIDFQASKGKLVFAPGEQTKSLVIPLTWDREDEQEESFFVRLSNVSNAAIADGEGIGTIEDNDPSEGILLKEEANFRVVYERTLVIPNEPSQLSFKFTDLNFDLTDSDSINDSLEAALVDAKGNPLVHTVAGSRDAFFNWTEGESAALATGTSLMEKTISVNLAGILPGTEAKLIIRLVNNDSDTKTAVRILDVLVATAEIDPPSGVVPTANLAVAREGSVDFGRLSDVSSSIIPEYGRTSFNENTDVLYADFKLRNIGQYLVDAPLVVVVKGLSDPTVQVLNVDGLTPEGLPYLNLSRTVVDGTLDPEQVTGARTLTFLNPSGSQFTYELVILGQLNENPEFISDPDVEALVNRSYTYNSDAIDNNADLLTYELLIGPDGLEVDRTTGVVSWTPTVSDQGTHDITLQVKDGRGGSDLQTYTLRVLDSVPNRPPTFTTTPGVDGNVNVLYTYDADAVDPDSDGSIYSLIAAPQGMTVDPATGMISWNPKANQLGVQAVQLRVDDGPGGTAIQEFEILVQQEPGNHAPVIVSKPVVELAPTISNGTSVRFADFSNLSNFRLNGNTSIANPALRNGKPVLRLVENFDYQNGSALLQNPFELVGVNGENLSFRTNFEFQIADSRGVSDGDGLGADGFVFVISPIDTVGGAGEGIGYGGLNRSIGVEFDTYQNSFDISGNHIGIDTNGNLNSLVSRTVEADRLNNGQAWHSWVDYDGSTQQLEVRISQTPVRPAEAFVSQQLDIALILGQENFFVGFTSATGAASGTHDILSWNFEVGAFSKEAEEYRYTVVAVDSDQDLLTYSLIQAPVGMAIDSASGVISWRPTNLASATQVPVSVRVDDERGGFNVQEYVINVSDTPLGQIRGAKFNDLNNDGIWNSVEPGLANVKVYLDLNNNGIFDSDESSQLTRADDPTTLNIDETGQYRFTDLLPGEYIVREIVPSGYIQTFPLGSSSDENLIVNGSFEKGIATNITHPGYTRLWSQSTDIDGWTVTKQSVDYIGSLGWEASDGERSIELNGLFAGGIAQIFDTVPGQKYLVTFDMAGNTYQPRPPSPIRTLEVRAAEQSTVFYFDIGSHSLADMGWNSNTWEFTAIGEQTTLEFSSLTEYPEVPGSGSAIDNVAVFAVNAGFYTVLLETGEVVQDINFGNQLVGELPPNEAPIFTTDAPTIAQVGKQLRYETIATDPDFDVLTYDLPVKPNGMAIDVSSGVLVWQPTIEQAGQTYDVVLRVRDGQGGIALQPFQIIVSNSNTAPNITSTHPGPAVAGLPYQYRVRAQDAEGDDLIFQLSNHPAGATIDPTTGVLSFSPTSNQVGDQSFSVTVSDGKGGEATQTFLLNVVSDAPNTSPIITSSPREFAALDRTYSYQIEAFDTNGDPLIFSLATGPANLTINETGLVSWTPTPNQLGTHSVVLHVSDARGGLADQEFTVQVLSQIVNLPPSITSTPTFSAVSGQEYQYNAIARDPDGDRLLWSLTTAPVGMSIDPQNGAIRWKPMLVQLGTHEITVEALDNFGGLATQTFTLNVQGLNAPPTITSAPLTQAAVDKPYMYKVRATDPNNDLIRFTLLNAPTGMILDAVTGQLQWVPQSTQLGTHNVEVLALDNQGGVGRQTYTLVVSRDAVNRAPSITSTPTFWTDPVSGYRYQLAGSDPDGDALRYEALAGPTGLTVNPTTGLVQWIPTTAQIGQHKVTVATFDPLGLGGTQSYTLIVTNANQAPVILSQPQGTAVPGGTYRYDVRASDPDSEPITIALTKAPEGMTVDGLGRITWKPVNASLGTHPIEISVTDSRGAVTRQTYDLAVQADQVVPKVNLTVSQPQVNVGSTVVLKASATDNVGVKFLSLMVNGRAVAIDAQGVATLKLDTVGRIEAIATATDAAGNVGTVTREILVNDPTDIDYPVVDLISLEGGKGFSTLITNLTDIIGTVSDTNLVEYTLSIAPVAGGSFTTIYTGTNSVTGGYVGTFDPSILQNDSYFLRLSATDAGGRKAYDEIIVDVAGGLKLGNFKLSFTDLSIPVSGIPIQVTRTYDTLTANTRDDFGYGWRMEFRDTDLRTSLGPDPELDELGIASKGFQAGDRVYITLPGGNRQGFTFQPKLAALSRYISDPNLQFYTPAFVPDPGVTTSLSVQKVNLIQLDTGEFASLNGGRYNPANGLYSFGGYYDLTSKEGIVYRVDGLTGDLETIRDRNNNTVTFTDSSITSSTGQKVTFERDAQGRITNVIDPEGKRVTYKYDALGDLVTVTDRKGNTTQFGYNDQRVHYLDDITDPLGRSGVRTEYDETGRLKRMIDAEGNPVELLYNPDNNIQQVRDQLGHITTYEYDQRGNVLTEVDALGGTTRRTYDADNNTLTQVDPLGNATAFTYDTNDNVLTETDALSNVTRYTYDANGNVLTTTDPTGQTTTNSYDSRGNLTQLAGQASGSMTFSYDARGNLTRMKDGSGTTTFEYDAAGDVTRQTDASGKVSISTYDANGNRTSETTTQTTVNGVRNLVTQMVYDSEGRVIQTTNAEGGVTRTVYDAVGNRIEEIDALGRSTKYRYDDRGQLIETIYPDATPTNDSDNPRTRTEYDAKGQVIAEIDELGRVTRMVYDVLGRQLETIYPDATPTNDSDNPRTRTEYDAAGRMIAQIDERGNRTEFRYDKAGRLLETILPDDTPANPNDNPRTTSTYDAAGRQTNQTDALGQVTRFRYDELGRSIGQTYVDVTTTQVGFDVAGRVTSRTDQQGVTTRFEYDALGRLKAVTDAHTKRTEYTYDNQGNLIAQRDANGNTTRYEYDRLNLRTDTVLPLGQHSTSTYDAVGNLSSTTDFNGDTITYRYDARNRLTFKDLPGTEFDVTYTYTLDSQLKTVIDARGTTTYSYDVRNRLLERIDPDSRSIAYSYDLAGNRTSVIIPSGTTAYSFDSQNRLKTVIDPQGGTTTYTYNAAGNLTRAELPNGTTELREYDSLNRLLYIENRSPGGIINGFRYTLDKTGNRTQVVENDGRRVEYAYDLLYRLTKETVFDPGATSASRTIEYAYDDVGNRLSRIDSGEGTTLYTYDNNDQLKTATLNGTATTYTYDDNGNTTGKTTNGNTITYNWNTENRLISADTDGNGTVDVLNRYNENGIRVSQTANGQETKFLIDANLPYAQVLEEYAPGGSVNVSYVYGHDLISQNRGGERTYYHVDGLDSTRALTDINGIVADRYTYDAFGQIISSNGDTENLYLFAGEQHNAKLKLDYLRARYFDSSTGRLYSVDPFEGFLISPDSQHPYSYAKNSPANYIDPSGKIAVGASISELSTTVGIAQILSNLSPALVTGGLALGTIWLMKPGFEARELGLRLISYGLPNGQKYYEQGSQLISLAAGALDPANKAFNYFFIAKDFIKSLQFEMETFAMTTAVSVTKIQRVIIASKNILIDIQRVESTFVYSKQVYLLRKIALEFSDLYGATVGVLGEIRERIYDRFGI